MALTGLSLSLVSASSARAVSGGDAVTDGSWGFVAKLNVGDQRACTGALVGPQWVITATSCFSVDGKPVSAGAPPLPTTVTVGRADLSGTAGRVLPAVSIVPHPDRYRRGGTARASLTDWEMRKIGEYWLRGKREEATSGLDWANVQWYFKGSRIELPEPIWDDVAKEPRFP